MDAQKNRPWTSIHLSNKKHTVSEQVIWLTWNNAPHHDFDRPVQNAAGLLLVGGVGEHGPDSQGDEYLVHGKMFEKIHGHWSWQGGNQIYYGGPCHRIWNNR